MFRVMIGTVILLTATLAEATPFDGLYYPAGMSWSCDASEVGMDGGAVAVSDGYLRGVENSCELTLQTNVRGMDAILYDAVCSGEGEEYPPYRLMLMRHSSGIYIIDNGHVADWRQCR